MFSKNKAAMTADEKKYVARVAELPCSVCDAAGPSEIHEIDQGLWWCAVSLCHDCHRHSFHGHHGQKRAWLLRKITMNMALATTIRRLFTGKD